MTRQDTEWGPWIEHDGKGIPVPVGVVVHAVGSLGTDIIEVSRFSNSDVPLGATTAWHWALWEPHLFEEHEYVIRYRIRKPRGLIILEGILEALDTPLPSEVPA